jgi:Family of unknown function (DUF6186)
MSVSRIVIIGVFILAAVLFAVVGLMSHRENSKIPTLGDLSGFVMEYQVGKVPVGRVAVLGFWWWVGWHFFAR